MTDVNFKNVASIVEIEHVNTGRVYKTNFKSRDY